MNTKDIKLGQTIMGLFLGPNGSGKTIGAASIHKVSQRPIRIWDFDGRTEPIKAYYPDADISFQTYGPRNFSDFMREVESECMSPKYGTYILDSFTGLSISSVTYQLRVKGTDGKGKDGKITGGGIPVTTWDEINGETVIVSNLLEQCKYLHMVKGCNIIWTGHPISKTLITGKGKDQTSERYESIAAYGNKTPSITPGFFNEIYFFDVEPGINSEQAAKRIIRTTGSGYNNLAKTCLPLPKEIEWTKGDLFSILHSYLNKEGIKLEDKPIISNPTYNI